MSTESLCFDPIHGYISFVSTAPESMAGEGEVTERAIIDHPWVQRLRQIHQLQTAWWVFPTAEHTRFQHVLGVMHLASRVVTHLYPSLKEVCPDVPSLGYVETLMRMAGLLHDVGHGPFGHFFDDHYLKSFGLTHEILGAEIIERDLAPLLQGIRRNPNTALLPEEQLDASQLAWLIQRPKGEGEERPRWLIFLRSLLSGIYTIDNMDFVLRDAYMSGYSQRSFDLDRLLRYSFFSERGLTIHDRGLSALIRFMNVRAELFQTIYFHREVMAIDKTLEDLFRDSKPYLLPENPLHDLPRYQGLTEFSLLVDVGRWPHSENPEQRRLGEDWGKLLRRDVRWRFVCERSLRFGEEDSQQATVFRSEQIALAALREELPSHLREIPLKVSLCRTVFRPHTQGPSDHQNFLYDSAQDKIKQLTTDKIFRSLPLSRLICRIYAEDTTHVAPLAAALDGLVGDLAVDDLTNM
ncbi:MAG: HD domain-containing protein [Pirellulaceae bacterium]